MRRGGVSDAMCACVRVARWRASCAGALVEMRVSVLTVELFGERGGACELQRGGIDAVAAAASLKKLAGIKYKV